MARASARSYGGQSSAERRSARSKRLLEAGLDCIGNDGWRATTVRGVCRRAQLSTRFFYESFEDLDALAVAVFDMITGEAMARALRAMKRIAHDAPLEKRVRAGINAVVDELTRDPRRGCVAFVEALGSEPLMRRRLATMRGLEKIISGEIQAAYELQDKDNFLATTAIGLAGVLTEMMIVWLNGQASMSRRRFVEHSVSFVMISVEGAARACGHGRVA